MLLLKMNPYAGMTMHAGLTCLQDLSPSVKQNFETEKENFEEDKFTGGTGQKNLWKTSSLIILNVRIFV